MEFLFVVPAHPLLVIAPLISAELSLITIESNFWPSADAVKADMFCRCTWNKHVHLPIVAEHQLKVFVPRSVPHHSTDAHLQLTQTPLLLLCSSLVTVVAGGDQTH